MAADMWTVNYTVCKLWVNTLLMVLALSVEVRGTNESIERGICQLICIYIEVMSCIILEGTLFAFSLFFLILEICRNIILDILVVTQCFVNETSTL